MSTPVAKPAKTYFIHRNGVESGPFTVPVLNRMRTQNEIAGADFCRASDEAEYRPLGEVFPHMRDFVRKSPEQIQQQARTWEGNSLANTALICGILSWVVAGLVLGVFAMVLGIKSWLQVQKPQGLIGAVLGGLAFVASLLHILAPFLKH